MISIVFLEPETAGNVGFLARVMKNFGFKDLVLVNPKCDHLAKEALDRATHAKSILKKAKVKPYKYLKVYDYVVGTTARLGSDYNIPRSPLTPSQFGQKLKALQKKKVAVVFGREGRGLSNKEILDCDFVVTIPTIKNFPTMNVSHAAAIVLYEAYQAVGKERVGEHIIPASKKEKEQTLKLLDQALNRMEFATEEKKETQRRVWKRMLGKSCLTKREAYALMGFLKKVK
jgi:TrmH family RNA methyltransferase